MQSALCVKILILSLASICFLSARAPEPPFPSTIEINARDRSLIKMGESRYVYRMFFKLYDAALYASAGASNDAILKANAPFKLQFRYLREIDKSIILKSSAKILEKNLSSNELEQIAERLKRLNGAYRTVKAGDRSSLTYLPDRGSTLRINGAPIITVEGKDFAQLYFKIWLGQKPLSNSLKGALLGSD